MKIKRMLLVLVLACILCCSAVLLLGCDNGSGSGRRPGGSDDDSVGIAQLVDCRLDLSDAESVGLIQRGNKVSEVKNNVLVTVDADSAIRDAVFLKEDDTEVTLDAWYVRNLKVTENFIFVYYVNYECSMVTDIFKSEGDKDKSFAFDKATGKIYSLSALPNIDFVADSGDLVRQDYKFYKAAVVSGALTLTKLSSNDTVKEYYASQDRHGNIFVLNDKLNNQKSGNLYYYKQTEVYYSEDIHYGLGDDGAMYRIDNSESIFLKIERFSAGLTPETLSAPSEDLVIRAQVHGYYSEYSHEVDFIYYLYVFKSDKCFQVELDDYGDHIRAFRWNKETWYGDGYYWINSLSSYFDYETKFYYLDGEILIASENELFHFIPDRYNGEESSVDAYKQLDYNEIEYSGAGLIVTTEGINGTVKWMVYIESGAVEAKLLSEVYYGANVITIQPLN